MKKNIKTLLVVLGVAAIIGIFFVNTYTSSPGFTTVEMAQEFEQNKPTCYGLDFLLNAKEVAADVPGKSLCVGILK